MRSDRPWPRQSSVATANPRARRSRTVSKYFSIHSLRPWQMQTVPRRPAGGCQRAKRIDTPSGVLSMPVTKLSGTGLAGIETSFMEGFEPAHAYSRCRGNIFTRWTANGRNSDSHVESEDYDPLRGPERVPISNVAQAGLGLRIHRLGPYGRAIRMSLQKEDMPCELSI